MNFQDHPLPEALELALQRLRSSATDTLRMVQRAVEQQAASAPPAERETLHALSTELNQRLGAFEQVFATELLRCVHKILRKAQGEEVGTGASSAWGELSLVDDEQLEGKMLEGRLAQQLGHGVDSELRDVSSYVAGLMGQRQADIDHNPLKPEVLGEALYRAIESLTPDMERRRMMTDRLGRAFVGRLAVAYGGIVEDLRGRGVAPAALVIRQTGAGAGAGAGSEGRPSGLGDLDRIPTGAAPLDGPAGAGGGMGYPAYGQGPASGAPGAYGAPSGQDFMDLMRRISLQPQGYSSVPMHQLSAEQQAAAWTPSSGSVDQLAGLMAVNLIRSHREDLVQASQGPLDAMVIDLVATLFDQILSDARVAPELARQIARLQLPVLRVAIQDNSFFSSRKHPVRVFINRLAQLGSAVEDLHSPQGKQFLEQVSQLTQKIIDGEFDQIDIYTRTLAELEQFSARQVQAEVEETHQAVSLLQSKEVDLRRQQRYMSHLKTVLEPFQLPEFLRSFVAEVWSQTIVQAYSQFGEESAQVHALRKTAADLIMSAQPKGTLAHRQRFISQLPGLVKSVTAGLQFIGWPEDAQKAFFATLMSAHGQAMKGKALTELENNLLSKQVESVLNGAIPSADGPIDHPLTKMETDEIARIFSKDEANRIGLMKESDINWDGHVDIDLSEDVQAPANPYAQAHGQAAGGLDHEHGAGVPALNEELDIPLGMDSDEGDEPSSGPDLIHHMQVGFAYRLYLRDEWRKARLSHISPGRSFFVFSFGKGQSDTVSFTHRMFERLCATGRIRALESSHLLERATERARRQLAELRVGKRPKASSAASTAH